MTGHRQLGPSYFVMTEAAFVIRLRPTVAVETCDLEESFLGFERCFPSHQLNRLISERRKWYRVSIHPAIHEAAETFEQSAQRLSY